LGRRRRASRGKGSIVQRELQADLHAGGAALSLFTAGDVESIHSATLDVLERAGVLVEADDALDVFADAGCRVDRETHLVRIPPAIVTRCLLTVPTSFRLYGLDPGHDVVMAPGRSNTTTFSEPVLVNDLDTGQNRPSTKRDVGDLARLADYLDEIDVNSIAVTARDIADETAELHGLQAMLHNTRKPLCMSMYSRIAARFVFAMLAAVAGGPDALRDRPIMLAATCPVGPMVLPMTCTDVIIECARAAVPCAVVSMDMAGASAPITLAGTLVVQNCEQLASIVLQQLCGPGSAFVYGTCTTEFDMRCATAPMGSPEAALFQAGSVALANHYRLPSWTLGFTSDAKRSDCQAGHEKTLTGALAMLAGASIIEGPGLLEAGQTMDFGQLVADNEIVAMVRHARRGIPVNDRTTFVDEIISVGAGNEFLSSKSTLKGARSLSQTKLIDRQVREAWEAAGSPDYYEQAKKEARRILAEHEIEPLPADVAQEVRAIVEGAEVH